MNKSRVERVEGKEFSVLGMLKSSGLGVLMMMAVSLFLLFLGAFVAYSGKDPDRLTLPFSMASLFAGMFFGGFYSARRARNARLVSGVVFCAMATVLLFALRFALGNGGGGVPNSTICLIIACVMGVIGSFFGALGPTPRTTKKSNKKAFKTLKKGHKRK